MRITEDDVDFWEATFGGVSIAILFIVACALLGPLGFVVLLVPLAIAMLIVEYVITRRSRR